MNASDLHGKTANLTAAESTDLLAFLNSIEAAPENGVDVCEKPVALGAAATAELVLNQQEFQPGEHLSSSVHSAGSQSADFYVFLRLKTHCCPVNWCRWWRMLIWEKGSVSDWLIPFLTAVCRLELSAVCCCRPSR